MIETYIAGALLEAGLFSMVGVGLGRGVRAPAFVVGAVLGGSALVRALLGTPLDPETASGLSTVPSGGVRGVVEAASVVVYIAWPMLLWLSVRYAMKGGDPWGVVLTLGVSYSLGTLLASATAVDPPWLQGSPRVAWSYPWARALLENDAAVSAAFPSVHVAALSSLALRSRWGLLWTGATALAVVSAGEHWVSDALAGMVLGLTVAISVRWIGDRRGVLRSVRFGEDVRDGDGGLQSPEAESRGPCHDEPRRPEPARSARPVPER